MEGRGEIEDCGDEGKKEEDDEEEGEIEGEEETCGEGRDGPVGEWEVTETLGESNWMREVLS
jgi:hypothetical protein